MKKLKILTSVLLALLITLSTFSVSAQEAFKSSSSAGESGKVEVAKKSSSSIAKEPTGADSKLTVDKSIVVLNLNGTRTAQIKVTPGGYYPNNYTIAWSNNNKSALNVTFVRWEGDSAVLSLTGKAVDAVEIEFSIYDSDDPNETTIASTTVGVLVCNTKTVASKKNFKLNLSGTNTATLKIYPDGTYPKYFGVSWNNNSLVKIDFKKWAEDTAVFTLTGVKRGKTTLNFKLYENITGDETIIGSVKVTVTVQSNQTIKGKSSFTKKYGASPFSLGAKAKTKMTYKSSDKKVAAVSSSGKVTVKGCGKAVITIKAKETTKYKAKTKKVTILVKPGQVAITKKTVKKGYLNISFKKQANCTGYNLQVSTKKNFASKYTSSAKLASYASSAKIKTVSGYYYYIRIRAYKKIGGKTYYGAWRKATLFA
ncbi:MAG: hypothetical protein IJT79_07010 [Ruminococcus sp.]|nr:hypothetical protein [Ruminococcus sp.]